MKKAKEKFVEWACTPKGAKIIGRVAGAFSAVAAGTMGYLLYDIGRSQGACDILVEEKANWKEFGELLNEIEKEILEEESP